MQQAAAASPPQAPITQSPSHIIATAHRSFSLMTSSDECTDTHMLAMKRCPRRVVRTTRPVTGACSRWQSAGDSLACVCLGGMGVMGQHARVWCAQRGQCRRVHAAGVQQGPARVCAYALRESATSWVKNTQPHTRQAPVDGDRAVAPIGGAVAAPQQRRHGEVLALDPVCAYVSRLAFHCLCKLSAGSRPQHWHATWLPLHCPSQLIE